jgi:ATP-dependent Lhr-like helicase
MLDRACLTGRLTWDRSPQGGYKGDTSRQMNRSAAIRFVPRRRMSCWRGGDTPDDAPSLSPLTYKVVDAFTDFGALYFDELADHTGLAGENLVKSLRELAAAGRVTSDSFRGLTELLAGAEGDIADTGRWSLLRVREVGEEERVRHIAWALLRRYGVVFRMVLQREQNLPSWRELLGVYRRLEARGEVRGGRFVAGFSGEQFALPDAVGALRRRRGGAPSKELVTIGAADPLNLVGVIVPGERIAVHSRERLVLRGGLPLAIQSEGQLRFLHEVGPEEQWRIRSSLLASHQPASSFN